MKLGLILTQRNEYSTKIDHFGMPFNFREISGYSKNVSNGVVKFQRIKWGPSAEKYK